jgi:glycosyltransferase involved in cell wall biosynthesis
MPYGFESILNNVPQPKNDEFTIGYVGRLDTHTKGLDLLIEAFAQFQKSAQHSKLWIIGDGEGMTFLQNYIKNNSIPNVVLWGKKFGTEKDELIQQMHVFAHPSRNEGLPTAVLEAASFGVPSIVTQATNVAEYVSEYHAGIAIDNNNTQALVETFHKIHHTYVHNEMQGYQKGTQQMLAQVFAWPVLVEKYNELYQ